jgi:hypothetical protein
VTQHDAFRRFLVDVIARSSAEPSEPAEPLYFPAASAVPRENPAVGTLGTAVSRSSSGSARPALAPEPLGTTQPFAAEGFRPSGSEVPRFRAQDRQSNISTNEPERDEDERIALTVIDGRVSAIFAQAFACLQVSQPSRMHRWVWERVINDAGLFLDKWGVQAERLGWSAEDLFAEPGSSRSGGLVWRLSGRRVVALSASGATLSRGVRLQRDRKLNR